MQSFYIFIENDLQVLKNMKGDLKMKITKRMSKEITKFKKGIYCIHDELLFFLYSMIPTNVTEKIINGKNYLLVERYAEQSGITLIARIPDELLINRGQVCNYENLQDFRQEEIREQLKDKLSFSTQEIYLCNILLDNYIKGYEQIKMSDIHSFYRDKKFEKNCSI